MEEMFDVYDREGNYIGVRSRSFCHNGNPGVYHKPVYMWIINQKNEILVQKKSSNKSQNPNLWDMSCGGHVESKETSLSACVRETYEELGINSKEEDYIFLGEWINERGFELAQLYLLKVDVDTSEMKLQKEEVSEVKYLNLDEFEIKFYSDDFCYYPDDYKKMIINLLRKYIRRDSNE